MDLLKKNSTELKFDETVFPSLRYFMLLLLLFLRQIDIIFFHGHFSNLLHRGCRQFMLMKNNRLRVWDSTINQVDDEIHITGEKIKSYCYGVDKDKQ